MLGSSERRYSTLLRNERAMLRWMCKIKAEDDVSLREMYSRLSLQPLESRLRINRSRWYGHVERIEDWIKRCTQIDVSGVRVEVDHANNGKNQ